MEKTYLSLDLGGTKLLVGEVTAQGEVLRSKRYETGYIDRTAPLPLASLLSQEFGMPCYIDNDVKAATRAEMLFGYGRTSQHFIYINIGTGIVASGFLFPLIQERLNTHTMRFVTNGVVLTQLDPAFAGLIGAAAVAMNA